MFGSIAFLMPFSSLSYSKTGAGHCMIDPAQERPDTVLKAVLHIFLGHLQQLTHQVAQVLGAFFNREVGFTEAEVAEIIAADPVGTVAVKNRRGEFINPLIAGLAPPMEKFSVSVCRRSARNVPEGRIMREPLVSRIQLLAVRGTHMSNTSLATGLPPVSLMISSSTRFSYSSCLSEVKPHRHTPTAFFTLSWKMRFFQVSQYSSFEFAHHQI